MEQLDAWFGQGERVPVQTERDTYHLFVRAAGADTSPWTTFFHGYPSCSWDWAKVGALLPGDRRRLYIDHLGFGDSDKPGDHAYSLTEQLELAVQVWDRLGVEATLLVAHDYSVSMAQELLARIQEGAWQGPEVSGVVLMNGGLFFSLQQPRPIQRLLYWKPTGPLVARIITPASFERAFRRVFSEEHPLTDDEVEQHWEAITRRDGRRAFHPISRYHDDRRAHEARWSDALAETEVPLTFVWGLADPVAPPAMLDRALDLAPKAQVHAWEDVGHYPQIEVPERVAEVIAEAEGEGEVASAQSRSTGGNT